MDIVEKLEFIKRYDPDSAARLERFLGKKDALKESNVYGEKFTDRQFFLVFEPLLNASLERTRILEVLSEKEDTISGLSEKLKIGQDITFKHIKELLKKNQIEIAGHEERDAVFRRKI